MPGFKRDDVTSISEGPLRLFLCALGCTGVAIETREHLTETNDFSEQG